MILTSRPGRPEDFAAFYECCFYGDRHNVALRGIVAREWQTYYTQGIGFSMVVEEATASPRGRLVGYAQAVFVSDKLVERIRSAAGPSANWHATRPLPDGSWPLLSARQVCQANAGEGLNALTTWWGWAEGPLSEPETKAVRDHMDRTFALYYGGYRYKEVLVQAYGKWPRQALEYAGFGVVSSYSSEVACHSPRVPLSRTPYLLSLRRDEAAKHEGTHASRLFAHITPRLGLTPREQELLWLALLGRSDEEIAALIDRTSDTIKKRWDTAFDRARQAVPHLLPAPSFQKRGTEKRQRLLEYVREHLEELRPASAFGFHAATVVKKASATYIV